MREFYVAAGEVGEILEVLQNILVEVKALRSDLEQDRVATIEVGPPVNWQALHNMLDDGK